jgi:hypothetical protein
MASILDILGNAFKKHVQDVRTDVKATNFANSTLKAMGFKARNPPTQAQNPTPNPPPAPGVKNTVFDLLKSVPRAAIAAGNTVYEGVPKVLNALDRSATSRSLSGVSPFTGYVDPVKRGVDESLASVVARRIGNQFANTWTAGNEAAKLAIPAYRSMTTIPKAISAGVNELPEWLRGYVGPLAQGYAVLNSPSKITTAAGIGLDYAIDGVSRLATGKGVQQNIDESSLPQEWKDVATVASQLGPAMAGAKIGSSVERKIPAVQSAGKYLANNPTDIVGAVKAYDTKLARLARDAVPSADVLGYRNVPVERVNPNLPAKRTSVAQIENKPLALKIAKTLDEIDAELGLARPGADDFGKAQGILGNVMGAPAMVRKSLTGSSLPLIQQATGKGREAIAKAASKAMSRDDFIGKTARGTKSLVGGLGKTQKSVDDLGKVKGLMADINQKAEFISNKVYDELRLEAKQARTGTSISNAVDVVSNYKGKVQDSLEKIHAIMDPDLANQKYRGLTVESLSPAEAKSYNLLVKTSDVINDMSYQIGGISKEQWMAKQGGKYITRAYTPIDFPDDTFINRVFGKKAGVPELDAYKKRGEITPWKQENAIRDPVYLVNKRLVEVGKNMAVQRYFNQVSQNPEFVSDVKRPGFVKVEGAELGLHGTPDQRLKSYVERTYGVFGSNADDAVKQIKLNGNADEILATQNRIYSGVKGKYVRQDVLDDIQGFSFATDALQGIYDIAKRTTEPPTRVLKVMKTALSLPTRLQNKVSNLWYATVGGVNPVEMVAERAKIFGGTVKDKLVGGGDYRSNTAYRFLLKNGALDGDFSKNELRSRAKNVAYGKEDGLLKKGYKYAVDSYGAEDVKSKVAYASVLMRRGYSAPEILTQVRDNFQDYSRVGKVFDFASKMPVGGLPFSKWKSEGARLFKNSLVNRPIRALTLMLGFQAMKTMMSEEAGELPENRQAREERVGATTMPFSDLLRFLPGVGEAVPEYGISTEVMIPDDAADFFGVPHGTVINVGRLWGQSLANEDPKSRTGVGRLVDSLSPVAIPKENSTKAAVDFFGSGMLLGPAVQMLADTNFMGRSIKDPEVSKYQPDSFISPAEQWGNRGEYALRQYTPPIVSDALDMKRILNGEQTYYGSKRTPEQQLMRAFTGLKSEVFDSGRVDQMREYQEDSERKETNARINANIKQVISKAAKTKSIDLVQLKEKLGEYRDANSIVSEKDMNEAMAMQKYADQDPQEVREYLYQQKRNTSTRNALRLAMNEMVDVGVRNVGVRDEYTKRMVDLMRAFKATYEDEDDYRKAGGVIMQEMKTKWK